MQNSIPSFQCMYANFWTKFIIGDNALIQLKIEKCDKKLGALVSKGVKISDLHYN